MNKPKQVIVMRNDLNMRKGKMVAQGSHASGAVFSNANIQYSKDITMICVRCDSEEELLALAKEADGAGLLHFVCKDAGLTEFNGVPTITCLAIGPAPAEEIDKITGHLKLL